MIIEQKSKNELTDDETLRMSISEKLKNYVPDEEANPADFKVDETPDEPEFDPGNVWDGYDR